MYNSINIKISDNYACTYYGTVKWVLWPEAPVAPVSEGKEAAVGQPSAGQAFAAKKRFA